MRQLPFFILLGLTVGLGGCSSSPPPGTCAGRVSDFCPHPHRLLAEHRKPLQRVTVFHGRPSHQIAVPGKLPKEDIPEPRINSTAWWLGENARLAKAINICRGCSSAPVETVSRGKPGALPGTVQDVSTTSSLQGPSPTKVEMPVPTGKSDRP
jgi:hypothetical protein